MNWLKAHFASNKLGPSDCVLSRHVEILREDQLLKDIFGGESRIMHIPTGQYVPTAVVPVLWAQNTFIDPAGIPGMFEHTVRVTDGFRFPYEQMPGSTPLWEPGLASLIEYIKHVVMKKSQLPYTLTGGGEVPLAQRCGLRAVSFQELPIEADSRIGQVFIDFDYEVLVSREQSRIYALVTAGA